MKKMYVMAAAAMLFAGSAVAQVGFGVEAGLNLNNLADKYEGETTSNQIKTGFHAGIFADLGISNNFSIAPGLRYSMKGGLMEGNYNTQIGGVSASVEDKHKLTYHYVELPVNFVYKTGTPGSGRFLIGAGPYVAYMVNAQEKLKRTTRVFGQEEMEEVSDRQIPIGEKEDDELKALDYGAQAFLGYQAPGGVFGKVGSQVGFANTLLHGSSTFYSKNYNFFATIGFMLGGRK